MSIPVAMAHALISPGNAMADGIVVIALMKGIAVNIPRLSVDQKKCRNRYYLSPFNVYAAPKTCAPNQHTCRDGTCIDSRQKCDGSRDCPDGSDEINCGRISVCFVFSAFRLFFLLWFWFFFFFFCMLLGPSPCRPTDIHCDGRCIPLRAQCDGVQHCRDNEDELNCGILYFMLQFQFCSNCSRSYDNATRRFV